MLTAKRYELLDDDRLEGCTVISKPFSPTSLAEDVYALSEKLLLSVN